MNTTNLTELKASASWQAMSPELQSTVQEFRPTFSTIKTENAPYPPYKLDAKSQTITFSSPIKKEDIRTIYNSTTKSWIYLAGAGYVGTKYQAATLSADGLVLTCLPSTLSADTDKIAGGRYKEYTVIDDLPMNVPPAADWILPIIIFDPTQFNDKATYDGSFAIYESEARSLAKSKGTGLWMYISDFNKPTTTSSVTVTQKVDKTALLAAYAALGAVIEKL